MKNEIPGELLYTAIVTNYITHLSSTSATNIENYLLGVK